VEFILENLFKVFKNLVLMMNIIIMMVIYLFLMTTIHSLIYTTELSRTDDERRKREVLRYQQELLRCMRTKIHRNTSYHTNALPTTTSWDLEENEWTVRSSFCLSNYLPENASVNCSIRNGQIFKDYQAIYSETNFACMYLFQCALDIILTTHRKCGVMPGHE